MDLSRFPYLQGNCAPIDEERDFDEPELQIEGKVPENLVGVFMRNGANTGYKPIHSVSPLKNTSNRQWADAHGYNCTPRFDMETGEHQMWEYGKEANAGEPIFAPNPGRVPNGFQANWMQDLKLES